MKTVFYYIIIVVPLIGIFILYQTMGRDSLLPGLLFYVVIYRPVVDYYRLKYRGVKLSFRDLYLKKFFYYHIKYFKKLYS